MVLRAQLVAGTLSPLALLDECLAHSNQNASRNTYHWQNVEWSRSEALRIGSAPRKSNSTPRTNGGAFGDGRSPLWGIPVSLKDCFDLAHSPTSCGTNFYRELHGDAHVDSWLTAELRSQGSVITGKTHLHPLAYGITGQNLDFGDCLQPRDSGALTGGSSSGAAASLQEGSAHFAIGTDTGGSIRVPAALCGLVGYRASIERGNWQGGAHLAPSFDTFGCLFRHLTDAPLFASLFTGNHETGNHELTHSHNFKRFAVIHSDFLHDCEPEIIESLQQTTRALEAHGLTASTFDASWWTDSMEIFAPIQAHEAAQIHSGHFAHFEPSIRQRLEWGASITSQELAALRARHSEFRTRIADMFSEYDLLLVPAGGMARLEAAADHSQTRTRLLRYTTPFSLAGVPVVTVPCLQGGVQIAAINGNDEALLALVSELGHSLATKSLSTL